MVKETSTIRTNWERSTEETKNVMVIRNL